MRRLGIWLLWPLLAAGPGCYLSHGIDRGEGGEGPPPPSADATPPPPVDAGRQDARGDSTVDAEPPPPPPAELCHLEHVSGPTTILTRSTRAAGIVARAGGFDVYATEPAAEAVVQRMRVDDEGTISLGASLSFRWTARIAAQGGTLGVCEQDSVLRLHTFTGDYRSELSRAVDVGAAGGSCSTLAGHGGDWWMALNPVVPGQRVARFDAAGARVGEIISSGVVPGRFPLQLTLVGDELLWTSGTNEFGELELFRLGRGLESSTVSLGLRTEVAPTLAAWPHTPGHVAIVAVSASRLRLLVVDRDGRTVVTNPEVAFQMFELPAPAMVATPFGLIVAALNFGDLDPSSGLLEVHQIGPDATLVGRSSSFPIARAEFEGAAVSVAADERNVVVHWSDRESTRAVVLRCVE